VDFGAPERPRDWVERWATGLLPAAGTTDKQGSKLVRWAAVEAVSRYHGTASIKSAYRRISERRGRNIARIAAARRLLTLVYYGLRDGEIRCLADAEDAA
jgi:hypothetical protein